MVSMFDACPNYRNIRNFQLWLTYECTPVSSGLVLPGYPPCPSEVPQPDGDLSEAGQRA